MSFRIFILFSILFCGYAQAQVKSIDVSYNSSPFTKSSASGETLIEYNGYTLREVLSNVLAVPLEYIVVDSVLRKKTISIKILFNKNTGKNALEKALINEFSGKLGVELTAPEKEIMVHVAYLPSTEQISKSKCRADAGEQKKIIQINRTWKGNCVTIQELLDKISEWHHETVLNETNNLEKYNFSANHNNWEDISSDLKFNYGINIVHESRKIKLLYVKKL